MKTNYKPILVFMGIVLIVGAIVAIALDSTLIDSIKHDSGLLPGQYVKLSVYIDRGLDFPMMTQYKAEVGGCTNTLSMLSVLDTKVDIQIGTYKTITTNQVTTSLDSGGQWISACSFIPTGNYPITYVQYNKGGETCGIPLVGCSFSAYKTEYKTLTVTATGVSLQ